MNPLPPFDAELHFAPGQHPHSIGLIIVPTVEDLDQLAFTGDFEEYIIPESEGTIEAFCYYDHDGDQQLGFLAFARDRLTPATLVHETNHAALAFVTHKVMQSKAVLAKDAEDQQAYFTEALASVQEYLFQQAFDHLYQPARLR